jgi:diaminopimelate epimerase
VNFEKWQALGNDYVILEQDALPFALTPERVRAICAPHIGVCADGIVLIAPARENGALARVRIFNPDGSEAETSGNGVREAALYMRNRGWAQTDSFSVLTSAGEMRPTITGSSTCTVDMGRARVRSDDFPSGGDDGRGELRAGGRSWRFQHVQVGNPQCSIAVARVEDLEGLALPRVGPEIERNRLFPNRTNVSWYAVLDNARIRARIFERGAGETTASGTGAIGAAVAYVLDGGSSPVTVVLDGGELEVDVGESLELKLTGWAVPVFRGSLSEQLIEELGALE